jgi:hypothetical protein
MKALHAATINVDWDIENFKQIDEAKKIYLQARKEDRKVLDMDGNVVDRFHPSMGTLIIKEIEVKDGEFSMRIFDNTGDRRIVWNSKDPDQIKEAKATFDEYVEKGWKPYAISRNGNKGHRIHEFNPEREEIERKRPRSPSER